MFEKSTIRLGIAPIGWTNDDLPELGGEIPFERCVDEMAAAGFSGTEVGSKFPRDPQALRRALEPRALSIASQWFSAFLTTKPLAGNVEAFRRHAAFLKEMGAGVVVVSEQGGSIQGQQEVPVLADRKPVLDEAGWGRLVTGLETLGREARRLALKVVYHHHMGTVVQSATEVRRLMEGTDPALVSLLYDTGHLRFCGEDPLAVLRAHGPRVAHVHLKDIRADVLRRVRDGKLSFLQGVREGVFTVPGDGCIDFGPIFAELDRLGYTGWFVVEAEQDPAKANPLEYARKARAYIRERTGL